MESLSESNNFSRILVAVDGSEISMRAAEYAIGIAKRHGSQLFAVTALNVPYGGLYMTEMGDYPKYIEKKENEEAEKSFNEVKKMAEVQGVKVETEIIPPIPGIAGSIIEYADKHNIELIVVGTRGKTGFKKLLLGSVATDLVTYSSCPVIVIK